MQHNNPLCMHLTRTQSPYLSRPSLTSVLLQAIMQLLDVMPFLHCSEGLNEMYVYILASFNARQPQHMGSACILVQLCDFT